MRVLRFSADSPFRASFAPAYPRSAYPRPGYLQPAFPVAAPNPQSPDPDSGARCNVLFLSLSNIQRQTGQHNKRGRVDEEEESAGRARHTLGALGNENVPQGGVEIGHNGGEDARADPTRVGASG